MEANLCHYEEPTIGRHGGGLPEFVKKRSVFSRAQRKSGSVFTMKSAVIQMENNITNNMWWSSSVAE